jgi:hypothetical protein
MSSEQQVHVEQSRFLEWTQKYKVYKTVPDDGLELTDEIRPFVWTEFQNDDESFIAIGYTASNPDLRMPVVGYFLSQNPCPENDDEYEIVLSSTLIDCEDCEAIGEDENGEECSTCSGDRGRFVEFELPSS